MSQIETNPINTPTIKVENPTQVMHVKSPVQISNFHFDPLGLIRSQNSKFSIEQLDWQKLAQKNKYYTTYIWTLNSLDSWILQRIDWDFVKRFIPVGMRFNSFSNFNNFLISIKPTNNAFFKGLTMMTFDPAPSSTFYSDIYEIDINSRERQYQLSKIAISPKTSGEINVLIPINFPFEFFKNNVTATPGNVGDVLSNYPFGYLRSFVLSPLGTTSALTELAYTASAQVLDLQTAGLYINNATV